MSALASAIVRTYDSAATLEATLESLRAQDVPVEVVVVDSGSRDGTLGIAERLADRVVAVLHEDFSYGGALNTGAGAASSAVHVALSSHCVLPRTDWVRLAVAHLDAGAVGVVGQTTDAHGRALAGPVSADSAYLLAHPWWGFSNHASAWRADAWSGRPFDETLAASEDKEWTWRATAGGGRLVVDPRLVVPGGHRRSAGVAAYFRRVAKENGATHHLRPLPRFGVVQAVQDLVRPAPRDPYLSAARPLGRTRAVEVAARWTLARRLPRPAPGTVPGCETSAPGACPAADGLHPLV